MIIKDNYEIKDDIVILNIKYKDQILKCLIDMDDLEKVKNKSICASYHGNGDYRLTVGLKNKTYMPIGRFILNRIAKEHYKTYRCVDHINHNTLDNRKCNLRLVTAVENQKNRKAEFVGRNYLVKLQFR